MVCDRTDRTVKIRIRCCPCAESVRPAHGLAPAEAPYERQKFQQSSHVLAGKPSTSIGGLMLPKKVRLPIILALVLALGLSAYADTRTHLKPGWNLFSPDQDVEMGRQVSREAESQLSVLRNGDINSYIDSLGRQLASRAPGDKYPYQFKVV